MTKLSSDEEAILQLVAGEQLERTPQDSPYEGLNLQDFHYFLSLGEKEEITEVPMERVEAVVHLLLGKGLIQKVAGGYWLTSKGEIAYSQTPGGTFSTAAVDFVRFRHPELTEDMKELGYDLPPLPSRS